MQMYDDSRAVPDVVRRIEQRDVAVQAFLPEKDRLARLTQDGVQEWAGLEGSSSL